MGKKQHSKDRLFITRSEWKSEFGGKKEAREQEKHVLPFNCCCLSFQPVVDAVMTREGYLFEKKNIYKYLKEHHLNPCTGKKLLLKDLFPVRFYKNAEGEIHCPVTYKVFTPYSKIAAIRTSGNIYLYDCIKDLNIGQKNWTDLISGEAFTRDDIVMLQDPGNPELRNVSKFYAVIQSEEEKSKSTTANVKISSGLQKIVDDIKQKAEAKKKEEEEKRLKDQLSRPRSLKTSTTYSSSLTSSAVTMNAMYDYATDEEIEQRRYDRMRRMHKKGYVQLVTNMGILNIEVHCDLVPKTAENFLGLCASGKYNNCIFHRLIKNFMIQGGDPTGTGTGGISYFGHSFQDEFHPSLIHKGLGIVSMANSGPNTNNAQFFITFKTAAHLDNVHSVFGRVVGGLDVLQSMEMVKTDAMDKPTKPIMIAKAIVLVNPFDELDEVLRRELEMEKQREEEKEKEKTAKQGGKKTTSSPTPTPANGGIGRYLDLGGFDDDEEEDNDNKDSNKGKEEKKTMSEGELKRQKILEEIERQMAAHDTPIAPPPEKKKKIMGKGGFGDFSSW